MSVIKLGTLKVKAFEMIMGLPEETIREHYSPDDNNEMRIAMNALLVENADRLVMIDPGTATFLSKSLAEIYELEMEDVLTEAVNKVGYDVNDVTDVLFTHLHFDHGSGAFLRVVGGIRKVFPNARYVVCRKQLDHIKRLLPEDSASFFHKLLHYAGELTYFEDWKATGFEFFTSHGHTAHMQVPVIDAGDHHVLFATDLIPMRLHTLEGSWSFYDENKDLLDEERAKILSELKPGSQIIFYHDPVETYSTIP